jgi:hypothetical protein
VGAWVGEPSGARDERVAAVQRRLQCLKHAERVVAAVEFALAELRVVEHEWAPTAGHDLQRHRAGADTAGPTLQGTQRLQRIKHRPAGRGGVEADGLEQGRQEPPEALVAAQQLTPKRGVLAVGRVRPGGELVYGGGGQLKL